MTTAASTMAPMAMAMPPRDMMLAFTPCSRMTMKAISTPNGKETMATRADLMWNRNARQTRATTMNSSSSLWERVSTARSISPERSYTGTISTPGGNPFLSSVSFFLTAWMVSRAFDPERITITPPTVSPSPLRSAIPTRNCGPTWMRATSFNRTGTPFSPVATAMAAKSSTVFR